MEKIAVGKSEGLFSLNVATGEDIEITSDNLKVVLSTTIKEDNTNKLITFYTMLLTYTAEDQLNIGYVADTSTGKSYIPLEIAKYFPKEDVVKIAYASPKSFFHDRTLFTKPKVKLPLLETKDKEKGEKKKAPPEPKVRIIDLSKKIIIFIDMPHSQLLQHLRPLLSHDEKFITMTIADRSKNAKLRSTTITIIGYPTVIFCSANWDKLVGQEKTRLLLLSPETTQDKLGLSIKLRARKEASTPEFIEEIEEDKDRKFLKLRLRRVKNAKIDYVIIPSEFIDRILKWFMKSDNLKPRQQRDISRILGIVKGNALLNFPRRSTFITKNIHKYRCVIADENDVKIAEDLYKEIQTANELGITPEIYRIYLKLYYHLQYHKEMTVSKFMVWYRSQFHNSKSYVKSRNLLNLLSDVGLIRKDKNYADKRQFIYRLHTDETPENVTEQVGLTAMYLTKWKEIQVQKTKKSPLDT